MLGTVAEESGPPLPMHLKRAFKPAEAPYLSEDVSSRTAP